MKMEKDVVFAFRKVTVGIMERSPADLIFLETYFSIFDPSLFMWKTQDKWIHIPNRNTPTDIENKFMVGYQKGEDAGQMRSMGLTRRSNYSEIR